MPPWPLAVPGREFQPPTGRGVTRLVSDTATGRCTVCGRAWPRRLDGRVISHSAGGGRCEGSGQPPASYEDGRIFSRWALNWRFSKVTQRAGIGHWHAHEGRHTAVSIMSSNGVPIQEISGTVGHRSTHVTETVYRHMIVPAIRGGATVMDTVFGDQSHDRDNGSGHGTDAETA